MLCRRCSEAPGQARATLRDRLPGGGDGGVVCERCGMALVTEGLSVRLLEKVLQVTRMGLRGRDVLLRRPAENEER